MCGIFGVVSNHVLTTPQRDFLTSAMQAGQVRGLHGTGIMAATATGRVHHAAAAMSGTAFLESDEIKPVKRHIHMCRSAVGHNRFATSGAHNDENCHPFEFGDIVGVHNGTIHNHVLSHIDPKRSHSVDSGRVYAALSRANDPLDVLKELDSGSYSLVWYDTVNNFMHLARSSHRPMSLAVTKSGLYFASEMGMLGWLLARHGLASAKESIELAETDKHTLYTIPLDDLTNVTAKPYEHKHTRAVVSHVKKQQRQSAAPKNQTSSQDISRSSTGDGTRQGSAGLAADESTSNTEGFIQQAVNKFRLLQGRATDSDIGNSAISSNDLQSDRKRNARLYDSLEDVITDFPKLEPQIQWILDVMFNVNHDKHTRLYMIPMNYRTDGIRTKLMGFASNDKGAKEPDGAVLCMLEDYESKLKSVVERMPDYDDMVEQTPDARFPVITVRYESIMVRPTGELVVKVSPVPLLEPVVWVTPDEEHEIAWCAWACDDNYMDGFDDAQVASLWADLRTKDIPGSDDEDIPF